jgi:hypothetical protein
VSVALGSFSAALSNERGSVTIDARVLINEFGLAERANNAIAFIGAGMSVGAGYPSWDELVAPLFADGDIPTTITDAPLAALDYCSIKGRPALEAVLLSRLTKVVAHPTAALRHLCQQPITEFWTSNYDTFIEQCLPRAVSIAGVQDRIHPPPSTRPSAAKRPAAEPAVHRLDVLHATGALLQTSWARRSPPVSCACCCRISETVALTVGIRRLSRRSRSRVP